MWRLSSFDNSFIRLSPMYASHICVHSEFDQISLHQLLNDYIIIAMLLCEKIQGTYIASLNSMSQ